MRTPIVAGNWKMNTTQSEASELVSAMKKRLNNVTGMDKVLCPPFPWLTTVNDLVKGTSIKVGAQNMYFERKGAFTGEVSPAMLGGLCDYVILGHSERRGVFAETDDMINRKVKAALADRLIPIVCVGETLEQNEAGETVQVITRQVKAVFEGVESLAGTVLAYEPIWAIGTGKAARGDQANAVMKMIRETVGKIYGDKVAGDIRIQYGGSVTGNNIAEFVGQPDIDGALVGGASLKPDEFVAIAEKTAEVKAKG